MKKLILFLILLVIISSCNKEELYEELKAQAITEIENALDSWAQASKEKDLAKMESLTYNGSSFYIETKKWENHTFTYDYLGYTFSSIEVFDVKIGDSAKIRGKVEKSSFESKSIYKFKGSAKFYGGKWLLNECMIFR